MNLTAFKDKLFEKAKAAGFEEYELYFQNSASTSINVFNQEVAEFKNSATQGVSFRGKYGGKMGYASSERIDDNVVDFLVESAKANAAIIETEEHEELYPGDASYPEVKTYNDKINQVSAEAKIELALKSEAAAKAADEQIKAVPYCTLANVESELFIANSKGLNVSGKSNGMYTFAQCQASDGKMVKMGGDFYVGNDFGDFNPDEFGKKAAGKAVAKLGASSAPGGKYAVIIDAGAASSLLSVFFGGFSAENVQKGFSMLAGKLGEKIAGNTVTIVDDPLIDNVLGSRAFDSEGVAAYKKVVVENGMLKTFLHNTKTARKDGVKPTGNGFKSDFRSAVNIGATNFFIQPGDADLDKLMEQMGDGLLITDFAGLHSGANATSGDFSLLSEGFMVEGGKKGRPVEQITVSGNFFQLMKDIVAVGSDLKFRAPGPYGNIAAPSLRIEALDVAGAK